MFSTIYVEASVRHLPRTQKILERFPCLPVVECERYGEVFNRNAQNFRLQKRAPALILAYKHGKRVLPAPAGYGFKADASFYFSHMLNCVYDCRYCFLQGMYRSANYVLFVNYEDFAEELMDHFPEAGQRVFYSGYDCDSLALEPVSEFCDFFLPLFRDRPESVLEIRSKSTQVRRLLDVEPMANCVIAMSFSPRAASERWEHKVPAIDKRLEALARLQVAGWPIALRFEPVIAESGAEQSYFELFEQVFTVLDAQRLHSVSLGEFRMPKEFHRRIERLYPDEALFARSVVSSDGLVSLAGGELLLQRLEQRLLGFVPSQQYYRCA